MLFTALSTPYRKLIYSLVIRYSSSTYSAEARMNNYAAFVYVTETKGFSAIDILNNSVLLNQHFCHFIGFTYSQTSISLKTKYEISNTFRKVFKELARENKLEFKDMKFSSLKLSDDAKLCFEEYNTLDIESEKLDYLNGWQITSKDGKTQELFLDEIYCKFGLNFSNIIHGALIDYGLTQRDSTLRNHTHQLCNKILNGFTLLDIKTVEELESKLAAKNVHYLFRDIMDVTFASYKIKGNDEYVFFKSWRRAVNVYTKCFIDTKIFDAPLKPFITPVWKKVVNDDLTFSIGGTPSKQEKDRWFGNISLHVKDEEAVTTIQKRLERDILHVKHVCEIKFKEIKERHKRNINLSQEGIVKHGKTGSLKIGADKLENTIATFYKLGIGGIQREYTTYLGFYGDTDTLNKELNLPTVSTMNVLLSLLVLSHPKITPSWLSEWELYDKKGNQVGFKQVGKQWIAVSYKNRRGATLAQQEVILTDETKEVIEFLIEHTKMARERLKSIGSTEWRKMIIFANVNKAFVYSNINIQLSRRSIDFYLWLSDSSLIPKGCELTEQDIKSISEICTLRSLRRHRALQIYLETRKIKAVKDALGHKEVILSTLSSYIPKPLMDFFNERWIRQFQNAILFEAMKDSKYLFESVDIEEKDITEFLSNHGINNIPETFNYGFGANLEPNRNGDISFDGATFTISTALLQLLIAIKISLKHQQVKHHSNTSQNFGTGQQCL